MYRTGQLYVCVPDNKTMVLVVMMVIMMAVVVDWCSESKRGEVLLQDSH